MTFSTQLRIPGPTPIPERVVRSMNRPMIDHRGPEFAAILAEVTAGAKRVFRTKNDLLLLTSSGTGGLESAVANLVSPGDEVVVALCGNFGERFAAGLDGAPGSGPGQRQRARVGPAGEVAVAALLLRLEGGEDLGGQGNDALHACRARRLRAPGRPAHAGRGRPGQGLRAPRAA